jgi:hypothetical protein
MKHAERYLPLAIALSCACNSLPPPASIEVGPETPETVAAAIAQARDAWCVADVGWCPEIVSRGGEARVYVTDWDGVGHQLNESVTFEEGGWTGPAAHTSAWRVEVAPQFATELDLTWVLVHEFGHFAIGGFCSDSKLVKDGHVPSSLIMRAAQLDGRPAPEVDDPARRAWLECAL